jgi:hypothetical protein
MPDFGRPQPVAVGQEEEDLIALVPNHGKQALQLVLRQKL